MLNAAPDSPTGVASLGCRQAVRPHRKSHGSKTKSSRWSYAEPTFVMVGDTPYDAEAAGKAGVRTIGVLSGGWTEHDLRQAGCIAVYRNLADLLQHYSECPIASS